VALCNAENSMPRSEVLIDVLQNEHRHSACRPPNLPRFQRIVVAWPKWMHSSPISALSGRHGSLRRRTSAQRLVTMLGDAGPLCLAFSGSSKFSVLTLSSPK
jgi:hypothetical protein